MEYSARIKPLTFFKKLHKLQKIFRLFFINVFNKLFINFFHLLKNVSDLNLNSCSVHKWEVTTTLNRTSHLIIECACQQIYNKNLLWNRTEFIIQKLQTFKRWYGMLRQPNTFPKRRWKHKLATASQQLFQCPYCNKGFVLRSFGKYLWYLLLL